MLCKERIIETAFKVWGEECYRTRSLTEVAKALGVSKAALYRHFKDKDELIEALYRDFYSRFIPLMEELRLIFQACSSPKERFVTFGLHLARYFIRKGVDFGFLLFVVMNGQKPEWTIPAQLRQRAITFEDFFLLSEAEKEELIYRFTLIFSTVSFYCGLYYLKQWYALEGGEGLFLEFIEGVLRRGLGLDARETEAALVSFGETEGRTETSVSGCETGQGFEAGQGAQQSLIAAIAAAVAERGPWEASMSYVAERSGLSKSGLYAHFASKEAMLEALFKNEYEALLDFLAKYLKQRERAPSLGEGGLSRGMRLWQIIDALYSYLSAHRDLLVILDWVRIQRIDIGKLPEKGRALWDLMGPFPRLTEKLPLGPYNTHRWILFSLISLLMMQFRQPGGGPERKSIQKLLFTYLAAGVEGWCA